MDKKKTSVFTESLLNYQLSTDPSPVLISPQPGEGAELYASFQIRVTPKSTDAAAVSKLYFILSLGNSETDISSSDEASSFSVSDDSKWQFIRLSPGLYQASPVGGKDRERIGKEGIVFNIYNLPVNPEVQSTVITVKEESYGTSGSLIKSIVELPIGTSSFVKDFYFENFIAEKPVVELHGKAVLKWIGSDNAGYLLYSSNEPWNPPLDVSKQRTWTSPPLTQNTIFVLTAAQVVNGETKRRDLSVMVIVKGGKDNNNIYTTDGVISSTRTVKIEPDQQLKWIGSTKNIFSVGGNTFSVDAKNSRIGVGTDEPTKKLHVEGSSLLNGRAQIGELEVVSSNNGPGWIISHRGLRFTTGATEKATDMIIKVDGKVGVGTDSPTNVLHVNSSTKGAVRIVDGTQGTDKVLTSDASGVGTWKSLPEKTADTNIYKNDGTLTGNRTVTQNTNTLAFKGSAVNAFSVAGTTFSVDAKNNRIGVGTDKPTTKLHVEGSSLLNGRAQIGELQVLSSDNNPGRIISHRGLRFTTGATETAADMIIKQDGKVGVGTTSPTQKLDVDGIIKASGLIIEKGPVKMFGDSIEIDVYKGWKANTDGIFFGQVEAYHEAFTGEKSRTSIFVYVSGRLMANADGLMFSVNNRIMNFGGQFCLPIKKGDSVSCRIGYEGPRHAIGANWVPLGSDDLNTFEYTGESTVCDSLENDMIVVEEDSFSSLFSKTMEKLMEDVPEEQREAKMERMVKKLMEG